MHPKSWDWGWDFFAGTTGVYKYKTVLQKLLLGVKFEMFGLVGFLKKYVQAETMNNPKQSCTTPQTINPPRTFLGLFELLLKINY